MLRQVLLQTLLFSAMILGNLAPAQELSRQHNNSDPHTTSDPARALYQHSAFAHGFIHGYEQGFHDADLDFHVGRTDRNLDTFPEYRKASGGYRENLGDRNNFQRGYREGFAQGYGDSFHSRRFRAPMVARAAAEHLKDYVGNSKELDGGFTAGYLAERSNPQSLPACQAGNSASYCSGFILGAEFGAGIDTQYSVLGTHFSRPLAIAKGPSEPDKPVVDHGRE